MKSIPKNTNDHSLASLDTFGGIAAEDDAVLKYFYTTDAVTKIENGDVFLVIGRKGSGKTALVRHFVSSAPSSSRSVDLRNYPWQLHQERVDTGASPIEAYVASWRYLIVVEFASLVMETAELVKIDSKEAKALKKFFVDNYGAVLPTLGDVLRPKSLKLSKFSFEPQVLGNKLGGISLERGNQHNLGSELGALTELLLKSVSILAKTCGVNRLILHFDELDQGLISLDEPKRMMLIGLILASLGITRQFRDKDGALDPLFSATPLVFLRTDLWKELKFSDKNKIAEKLILNLLWTKESLRSLIDLRLATKLGEGASWDDMDDGEVMRGSQAKWDHVTARTFLRPRDVIAFLNAALDVVKARGGHVFGNKDISDARNKYSTYLKRELDDEITPHWSEWAESLQACSAISTLTFTRAQFVKAYGPKRSVGNALAASEALEQMFKFSVIGYLAPQGYGGSAWVFQYAEPDAEWDQSSTRFKVHPGLKEFAKLKEER